MLVGYFQNWKDYLKVLFIMASFRNMNTTMKKLCAPLKKKSDRRAYETSSAFLFPGRGREGRFPHLFLRLFSIFQILCNKPELLFSVSFITFFF